MSLPAAKMNEKFGPMEYTICGHSVRFPHQAYGVQLAFMSKLLSTLTNRSNALLEAPTGSGKTLSLLCGALAWQERAKREAEEEYLQAVLRAKQGPDSGASAASGVVSVAQQSYDDPAAIPDASPASGGIAQTPELTADTPFQMPQQPRRVSKIYYATRTHSQIAQVVRELKRTTYQPKMAILASREQYCINPTVANKANKDEECEKLIRGIECGCKYFKSRSFNMQTSTRKIHDIEDLCKYGKAHTTCPFFASRHYAADADLVFCPYNYIIDPVVRQVLDINIQDAVLIFDEAHNIEDNSRDAASAEVEARQLTEARIACLKLAQLADRPEQYQMLASRIESIASWLQQKASGRLPQVSEDRFEIVWSGQQALAELKEAGLDAENVAALKKLYNEIRDEEDHGRDETRGQRAGTTDAGLPEAGSSAPQPSQRAPNQSQRGGQKLSMTAKNVLSRLTTALGLMYEAGETHVKDYRIVVQHFRRTAFGKPRGRARRAFTTDDDDDDDSDLPGSWSTTLCLWCLNPAVAFWELKQTARSVVLTSGTLAPLDTFASELGTVFPERLEAPHVVDMRRQVLAMAVPWGRDGRGLTATFKYIKDPAFQDAVGHVVLDMCQRVPDGVLVFVPSYFALDCLSQHWQTSGLWQQLAGLKPMHCEPRGSKEELDEVMKSYFSNVQRRKGALLLAVCRGKVSEGVDFADAYARAIIVIGIPFPNIKDTKVALKKQYNDMGRGRGLLTGEAWYSQQAFRALNQAIGRCLRNRFDFGMILLLDERFTQLRNQQHLSRWVRGSLGTPRNFEAAMQSATAFFERLRVDPPGSLLSKRPHPQLEPPPPTEEAARPVRTKPNPEPKPAAPAKQKPKAGRAGGTPNVGAPNQPTLRSLWQQNPQQQKQQRQAATAAPSKFPGIAGRLDSESEGVWKRAAPPSWTSPGQAQAAGWILPLTNSPIPAVQDLQEVRVQPGQGCRDSGTVTPSSGPSRLSAALHSGGHRPDADHWPSSDRPSAEGRPSAVLRGQQVGAAASMIDQDRPLLPAAATETSASGEAQQTRLRTDQQGSPISEQGGPDGGQHSIPDPGGPGGGEIVSLLLGSQDAVLHDWVDEDMAAFRAVIKSHPDLKQLRENERQRFCAEGIMDCFEAAFTSLADVLSTCTCQPPTGLRLVARSFGYCQSGFINEPPGLSERLRGLGEAAALQAIATAYDDYLVRLLSKHSPAGIQQREGNQALDLDSWPELDEGAGVFASAGPEEADQLGSALLSVLDQGQLQDMATQPTGATKDKPRSIPDAMCSVEVREAVQRGNGSGPARAGDVVGQKRLLPSTSASKADQLPAKRHETAHLEGWDSDSDSDVEFL